MNEELNLRELFENFVKFVSRNNTLILTIVLLGIVSVILFQKLKTPYFETKAICISGISEYERVEYEEKWLQRTAIDLINYLEINVENKDNSNNVPNDEKAQNKHDMNDSSKLSATSQK